MSLPCIRASTENKTRYFVSRLNGILNSVQIDSIVITSSHVEYNFLTKSAKNSNFKVYASKSEYSYIGCPSCKPHSSRSRTPSILSRRNAKFDAYAAGESPLEMSKTTFSPNDVQINAEKCESKVELFTCHDTDVLCVRVFSQASKEEAMECAEVGTSQPKRANSVTLSRTQECKPRHALTSHVHTHTHTPFSIKRLFCIPKKKNEVARQRRKKGRSNRDSYVTSARVFHRLSKSGI